MAFTCDRYMCILIYLSRATFLTVTVHLYDNRPQMSNLDMHYNCVLATCICKHVKIKYTFESSPRKPNNSLLNNKYFRNRLLNENIPVDEIALIQTKSKDHSRNTHVHMFIVSIRDIVTFLVYRDLYRTVTPGAVTKAPKESDPKKHFCLSSCCPTQNVTSCKGNSNALQTCLLSRSPITAPIMVSLLLPVKLTHHRPGTHDGPQNTPFLTHP